MEINIGKKIQEIVKLRNLSRRDIMIAFRCADSKINRMYHSKNLKIDDIMKWSLLLDYNFFELYEILFIDAKLKK